MTYILTCLLNTNSQVMWIKLRKLLKTGFMVAGIELVKLVFNLDFSLTWLAHVRVRKLGYDLACSHNRTIYNCLGRF